MNFAVNVHRRVIGSALVLALCLVGCGPNLVRQETRPDLDELRVGGERVCWAEVVSDEASRQRGLMYRTSLEPDCGMLFVFEDEAERSFWMKNVRIPLDIAYIKADGTLIEIRRMEVEKPGSTGYKRYSSSQPVRFALEMTAGWFEKNGIVAGSKFDRLPTRASSRG